MIFLQLFLLINIDYMEKSIMDFSECQYQNIEYVFPEKVPHVVHVNVGISH
jgi:hypothetical protein